MLKLPDLSKKGQTNPLLSHLSPSPLKAQDNSGESKKKKKNKRGGGIPSKKEAKKSSIMFWNKGNGEFSNKKDEIELKIAKYAPIIFGILEVNMAVNAYLPALQISGYSL